MNRMMAISTQLDIGEVVILEPKGEQWTEENCSRQTLVEQSCGWGDDDDIYHRGWKDEEEQSTKASCSEWVYGDQSHVGTDDDEYKNGWGDDADTEPEQSTEEIVSETTDDDQTSDQHVHEAQTKDSNDAWKGWNDTFLSPKENRDWNASGNIIPGDADYVDKCKNPENEEERVKSPTEIRYEELPFVTKHYLLTYALHILEAICLRTGQQRFRKYLDDPVWKKLNLVMSQQSDDPDIRRVYGDWLTEDGVEVMWWVWFYGERAPGMPSPCPAETGHILNSIYILRNAAVHRGDEGDFDFKQWELAMQVPELLGDAVGKKEMVDLAEYVLGDGTLDEDVRADVKRKMYTPRISATRHQLLERIQTLLEESCYNLAVRKIPDVLTMKGWDCAEKVELPKWIEVFKKTEVVEHCDNLAKDFFRGHDSTILTDNIINLLHRARMDIRNAAAHRLPVSDEQLVNGVHTAIRTALLLSDWPRAFEIEVVSEMLLTDTSRQKVLDRLASSYRDGKAQTNYERRRRHELKLFLEDKRGKETKEEDDGEQLAQSAECDMEEEMVKSVWTRSIWSPSMSELLKKVEVVEVVKCKEEMGEGQSEKLASDTWEVCDDTPWGTPLEDTGS